MVYIVFTLIFSYNNGINLCDKILRARTVTKTWLVHGHIHGHIHGGCRYPADTLHPNGLLAQRLPSRCISACYNLLN